MWKYILKRIIALIPVIIGVTLIVYFIMSLAPGDPATTILGDQATPEAIAQLREEMGLNDPIIVQYARYMINLARGDMGTSYKTKKPVSIEVFSRFPATAKLSLVAVTFSTLLAIPLGMLAAVKQNSFFDGFSMIIALLGISMPIFWFGVLEQLLFSLKLGWLPSSGNDYWYSIILPAVALGFHNVASVARITRSSMLEVIRQDYIRTARSKGVPYGTVIKRHALRNALIPTVTVLGIQIGALLAGSTLTETVFAWPGMGRFMITSISGRDIPSVLGCIIIFTLCFSVVNLIVDLAYGFIDPRIKGQYK
ncbi:MAG: ABC transporter permease [Firmicutes bacterium]|nr:ABC transporter permease [Bacillota bacterium]MBQ2454725.1 ABC transporter permease [Bacillota bacterium]MBQ4181873.1 ABC transporter permease [Bacillota bacterium]MBQ4233290.1 ABC transporter permease [Bacillota bacterium]MBQ5436115.1 ABC transporter permease [Bacillota bacterium]